MNRRGFAAGSLRVTKNDMARVIICALYNQPRLPLAENWRVVRLAKRPASSLEWRYKVALRILKTRQPPDPQSGLLDAEFSAADVANLIDCVRDEDMELESLS